ncbi:MAG: MBL fold metallo-hydrolase [Burkholderiaceae bacterium]|nr:MBL fold metallo-hydrolase [Burkholderiaceae bacterium]
MQIHFHGATDCVTGSRHLVDIGGARIGLDCGLFQGFKVLRERNWAAPPADLLAADALVLSHAHLDHSGWLPVLVKHGWKGPVYASPATIDLAQVLLLDAAHLNEEDARRANRYGYSKHAKALPLYTRKEAHRALALLKPLRPGQAQRVGGATVTLSPVGHLLGACAVRVEGGGESLLFSGDVGRSDDLLMPPPAAAPGADVLLVESTYGNRRHPKTDVEAELGAIVRDTIGRGGSVLLPSFAVGRAQALLLALQRLKAAGEIPHKLPVFLDSPMAIAATELYRRHARLLRIPAREARTLMDTVHAVETAQQSMRLTRMRYPAVIISASGMATGGRVLHHLKHLAPDPRNHLVFAGFQVGGSRGARIVAGEPEVKIHGEYVPVRAQVSQLEGFSGHADADGLLAWLRTMPATPKQTYVVHGEPDAADTLRHRIQDELRWRVRVPQHGETVHA